jgi:phage-related protein
MEARLFHRGRTYALFSLVRDDEDIFRDFLLDRARVTEVERRGLVAVLQRAAEEPLINPKHFTKFKGKDGDLAEFRYQQIRILCFFDGPGRIVLTHGFRKKTNETPAQEKRYAHSLRQEYLESKDRRNER